MMKILEQMTLEEKARLLSGNGWWQTHAIERLNIPSIYLTDGPHGLRKADVAGLGKSVTATCFPTASALASSWNKKLLHEVGEALGKECQAHDVQILLGPGINMKRSPLGGRNFEYFSEDPCLAGQLAAEMVRGVQSQGVGSSLKHFAANNQELERMASDSILDERTLHEIYLRAFEIVVREVQPWSVMCSYNLLNGVYASENKYLLKEILRERWGFKGFVVSDWGAVNDRVKALQAGLDLEMPGSGEHNRQKIILALQEGRLSEQELNDSVAALLEIILKTQKRKKDNFQYNAQEHHLLARRAAGECIVLLKNEKQILPLDPQKLKKIFLAGSFAKIPRFQGAGSSQVNPSQVSNPMEELQLLLPAHVQLDWAETMNDQARLKAQEADVALVFVGLPEIAESEGFDRNTLAMPTAHEKLIAEVSQVQKKTVVILLNGSAVTMSWLEQVQGVLEAWLGGQSVGGAIADVLLGYVNPSGKLSETFPMRLEDTPTYPHFPGRHGQADYREGLYIGYRHFDKKKIAPQFPFGFGLSYSQFTMHEVTASTESLLANQELIISLKIKNESARAGAEVVQVYVQEQNPLVDRPDRELRTFEKVFLHGHEEKSISLHLSYRDFAFYDVKTHDWVVHSGFFQIHIGSSSRDLPLQLIVKVQGNEPKAILTGYSLLKEFKNHPQGQRYYQQLLKAVGIDLDAENPNEMLVAFLDDMPVLKIPAFSEGKLSDQALEQILAETNA